MKRKHTFDNTNIKRVKEIPFLPIDIWGEIICFLGTFKDLFSIATLTKEHYERLASKYYFENVFWKFTNQNNLIFLKKINDMKLNVKYVYFTDDFSYTNDLSRWLNHPVQTLYVCKNSWTRNVDFLQPTHYILNGNPLRSSFIYGRNSNTFLNLSFYGFKWICEHINTHCNPLIFNELIFGMPKISKKAIQKPSDIDWEDPLSHEGPTYYSPIIPNITFQLQRLIDSLKAKRFLKVTLDISWISSTYIANNNEFKTMINWVDSEDSIYTPLYKVFGK